MAHIDVYGRTHELETGVLDVIAKRLEARREHAHYMGMLHEYLDLLDLEKKHNVLVLGCGTGVEIRELIRRTEFSGRVTAVDISADLVAHGKRLFSEEGMGTDVDWLVVDAADTGLPDDHFDLVIAHTLISHVPEPEKVVSEISRTLKPGSTCVIFDGDYATMTFGTDDPSYGKMMDEKIISGLIANPRIMRVLPRLFIDHELELIDSRGWMLTEIGQADFFISSLDSFLILLPRAGVTSEDEITAFVEDQKQASAKGAFFGGYNFYAMIASSKS